LYVSFFAVIIPNKNLWALSGTPAHNTIYQLAYAADDISNNTFISHDKQPFPFLQIQLPRVYNISGGRLSIRDQSTAYANRNGFFEVSRQSNKPE
jgi:hypothetical protein